MHKFSQGRCVNDGGAVTQITIDARRDVRNSFTGIQTFSREKLTSVKK